VREEIVEPILKVLVCSDVNHASSDFGEKVVERLAPREALDESSHEPNGFDDVLFGRGVVDKTLERRGLLDLCRSVDSVVEPFRDDVKDSHHRMMVVLVILGTVTDLSSKLSSAMVMPL
jgi:hypothetical protein